MANRAGILKNKKKLALVLSGGGIKAAAFHIGVCLALKEKGFVFSGGSKDLIRHEHHVDPAKVFRVYVGSSAGAFVSTILAAGYDIESLVNAFELGFGGDYFYKEDSLKKLKQIGYRHIFSMNSRRLLRFLPEALMHKSLVQGGFEALLKTGFKLDGLFTTKAIEAYLRKEVLLENEFDRLGVELYIVATQLNHSRKTIFGPFKETYKNASTQYINYASISEAVACSTALPPVYSPYCLHTPEGKELHLYDGEIRETLSAHIAADYGADLVISSYSVQPYHFVPEIGSLNKYGVPAIINQALYQVIQQKIQKHIEWAAAARQLYKMIDGFFKQGLLPEEQRDRVLAAVNLTLKHRPETDYIYISPRPQNYEMFFVDHFSLKPKVLEKIARIGFRSALNVLKQYDL